MGRLSLLFACLLMISALSLVTARFQSRQLFVQADRLEDKARELDTDWRRLQLERAELARNARIDGAARKELEMVSTTPDRTLYIKGQAPAAVEPAASEGGRQ
jgi:cell division protein FtsL